jgi:hypothetical protein
MYMYRVIRWRKGYAIHSSPLVCTFPIKFCLLLALALGPGVPCWLKESWEPQPENSKLAAPLATAASYLGSIIWIQIMQNEFEINIKIQWLCNYYCTSTTLTANFVHTFYIQCNIKSVTAIAIIKLNTSSNYNIAHTVQLAIVSVSSACFTFLASVSRSTSSSNSISPFQSWVYPCGFLLTK